MEPPANPVLFVLLALEGGFINGVQTTLYALGSSIYPTSLRAFGVGTATGVGRVGAIASSLLGAIIVGWGATAAFHWSIAFVMFIVAIALLLIRNHFRPTMAGRRGWSGGAKKKPVPALRSGASPKTASSESCRRVARSKGG